MPIDMPIVNVKAAEYLQDYQLMVTFDDGSCKKVDLANELTGPLFGPLQDLTLFKQVAVHPEWQTVYWPNGADLAPEFLYTHGVPYSRPQVI